MATKDWKKIIDNSKSETVSKIEIAWRKGDMTIAVTKNNQFVSDRKSRFSLEILDGRLLGNYSSKKEAIIGAKQYMRTN